MIFFFFFHKTKGNKQTLKEPQRVGFKKEVNNITQ